MGLLLNYPTGESDVFEYTVFNDSIVEDWQEIEIEGSWFPHAFIGSMAEIVKALNDRNYKPDNSVEDCLKTMQCVEAAYKSATTKGIEINNQIV